MNKTIKINPVFFSNKTNKKTQKKHKKINLPESLNTNKIKSNFLKRIKKFKKDKINNNNNSNPSTMMDLNNNNLNIKKKKFSDKPYNNNNNNNNNINNNIKNDNFLSSISDIKSILNENKEKNEKKLKIKNPNINFNSFDDNINLNNINNTNNTNNTNINNNNNDESILKQESFHNKKIENNIKKEISIKKNNKTIKIGKNKKKNSILLLIPNKEYKLKIDNYKKTLKNKGLNKIKTFLKRRGLIKHGCIAPNNVIREIYESTLLCGDVKNLSNENFIHNYSNL